jgi:hypothetical protein
MIQTSDDIYGAPVAVLSHDLWRTRFAADPDTVGRTIRISGQPFEVIGVATEGFQGASAMGFGGTRLWIPLALESSLSPPLPIPARERRQLAVFGRLKPSITVARASAELGAIAAGLDRAFPPRTSAKGAGASDRPWRAKSIVAIVRDDDTLRHFGLTLVALVGGRGARSSLGDRCRSDAVDFQNTRRARLARAWLRRP